MVANMGLALLQDPYDSEFAKRIARWQSRWIEDRAWGARADGRWVGTLATEPRMITVPGPDGMSGDLAADALTGVSVNPSHRRRGLLTQMLGQSLAAAKERGDAVSILIAAEWPIYGRFGYAPATSVADYTYFSRSPDAAVAPSELGSVRQVGNDELGTVAAAVFAAARRLRAGQVDRDELWWRRLLGLDGFERMGKIPHYYLHEGAAGPDGLLLWKVTRDFDLDGSLGAIVVDELVAANDVAYRNLWAFLSGIDAISEVALHARPVDEPARWLMRDGRALRQGFTGDFTWLRLLDVPAALSARSYSASGRLVLEVGDDGLGYAAGRFALEADGDGALCTPSTDPADLWVSAQALASAYLGGHALRALAPGGGVEERTRGALARADAMFATALAPWNPTWF